MHEMTLRYIAGFSLLVAVLLALFCPVIAEALWILKERKAAHSLRESADYSPPKDDPRLEGK